MEDGCPLLTGLNPKMLSVGIPKEIKSREKRVALVPDQVLLLRQAGITVFVESDAGLASGFENGQYERAGAKILPSLASVYAQADMIQKVKEPLDEELGLLRPGQFLFCFLHLASPENCRLVKVLCEKKITALAYETLEKDGRTPILAPMSEIAGGLSASFAAFFARSIIFRDGKVEYPTGFQANLETIANLYPSAPDFLTIGRVLIYGGGVAGRKAADFSLKMGGSVTLVEKNRQIWERLNAEFSGKGPFAIVSPEEDLSSILAQSEVVIGAVHVPGKRAFQMMTREQLQRASTVTKKVIMDISIDQGGNFPDSHPTSYNDPVYADSFGNIRFAVPNIPSLSGYGASLAISAKSIHYTLAMASSFCEALTRYPELQKAVNVRDGVVVNEAVREAHHP